jgi:hypothetical protein
MALPYQLADCRHAKYRKPGFDRCVVTEICRIVALELVARRLGFDANDELELVEIPGSCP